MDDDQDQVQNVQVRFINRGDDAPANPALGVPLTVPVSLGRYGLSELVNHLLSQDPPRPYEFIIDSEFLRDTLKNYLVLKGLPGESGLVLEYVEAAPAPESEPSFPHPDWVSSISAFSKDSFVTGCYDGVVRVWETDKKGTGTKEVEALLASGGGHTSAIKAVATFSERHSAEIASTIISASKDHTLRSWSYRKGSEALTSTGVYKGHTDSVECVATIPANTGRSTKFASGSYSKEILIWDLEEGVAPVSSKRRKTAEGDAKAGEGDVPTYNPIGALDGHNGPVSTIAWPHPNAIYTGSWDQSIRMWDANAARVVSSWNGSAMIACMDFSSPGNIMATGHNNKTIRIWDPRSSGQEVMKLVLRSHTGWVSSVAFSPTSPHHLISGGYDTAVKLWDIRSKVPLHSIKEHGEKVLATHWLTSDRLASGGADKKVLTHSWDVSSLV